MKNQNKVLGAIFVAIGLVNLIRPEWTGFGINTAIGSALLLESDGSASKKTLQILLTLMAFALLLIRLVTDFNG